MSAEITKEYRDSLLDLVDEISAATAALGASLRSATVLSQTKVEINGVEYEAIVTPEANGKVTIIIHGVLAPT